MIWVGKRHEPSVGETPASSEAKMSFLTIRDSPWPTLGIMLSVLLRLSEGAAIFGAAQPQTTNTVDACSPFKGCPLTPESSSKREFGYFLAAAVDLVCASWECWCAFFECSSASPECRCPAS
jgi:hypothetical protein